MYIYIDIYIYVYITCTHKISWYSSLVWELSRILQFFTFTLVNSTTKCWVEAPTETGRSEEGRNVRSLWVLTVFDLGIWCGFRQFFPNFPAFLDSQNCFFSKLSHIDSKKPVFSKKHLCSFPTDHHTGYWLANISLYIVISW